jgi:hypothetical protein
MGNEFIRKIEKGTVGTLSDRMSVKWFPVKNKKRPPQTAAALFNSIRTSLGLAATANRSETERQNAEDGGEG